MINISVFKNTISVFKIIIYINLKHFAFLPIGYFSWRNSSKGSWFVQALCRVLEAHGDKKEIMWLLTRSNHITAYEFQSNASKEFMNKKKQVSQIVSMLTKELYFTPKNKGTAV